MFNNAQDKMFNIQRNNARDGKRIWALDLCLITQGTHVCLFVFVYVHVCVSASSSLFVYVCVCYVCVCLFVHTFVPQEYYGMAL